MQGEKCRGKVTINTTEIKRIHHNYMLQTRRSRRDKFLETYGIPTLTHEEIENLNILITSKEIDSVIKTSQQPKVQDQAASLVNSTKHLKILYMTLSNHSKKTEENEMLPNPFCEASYHNQTRTQHTKKEKYRLISLMNIDAKILKNISEPNPTTCLENHTP